MNQKPHWLAGWVAALAKLISGARVLWLDCRPDTRQRIYFGNHSSHLDAVIIWASLPPAVRALTRPVAAQDYWEKGFRRFLSEQVFRAVLIPRAAPTGEKSFSAGREALERMVEAMGERHSLILFPEGTRGTGEEVQPFKGGLYHLCSLKPGVELVPVYLENLNRILPKGEVLPVPLLGSVTFGPPLYLGESESKPEFLQRAREALCRLQPR